ncbi:MAG TPA: hypothetical protein VFL83_21125 [Anaeromyxobacter sp.]|nr:hypothetical protein [Anaeromyxobacter sp.]
MRSLSVAVAAVALAVAAPAPAEEPFKVVANLEVSPESLSRAPPFGPRPGRARRGRGASRR